MVKSKVSKIGELLTKSFGFPIEVLEEETDLLTAPGEHYGSVMLKLKVKIKRQDEISDLDLVAKLIPANEMLRVAFDIPVTFKKEVFAYTETIPALVQLQKEFGVGRDKWQDNLFPKCFGARLSADENKHIVDEDAVLVFENLKTQGFITEDRLKGFDFSAAKVILQDLARFHAVPIALKLLKPNVFNEKILPATCYNKGLEQLPEEIGLAFHNSIMEGARHVEELTPYLERLQKVVDAGASTPWVMRNNPNEPWGTMCHADFWVSNTMIQKNHKGITTQNRIVDLQLMRYWSCCCDLVFFLFTSIQNQILDAHYEDFLKIYHETFVDTLKEFKLNVEKFSWDKFLTELNVVAPTELYHVLIMLKPIMTERGKVKNSSENFQNSDWSRGDLLGPNHKRKMKDTVLALVKRGWL